MKARLQHGLPQMEAGSAGVSPHLRSLLCVHFKRVVVPDACEWRHTLEVVAKQQVAGSEACMHGHQL